MYYRHYEILRALKDNFAPLNSREVFNYCKEQPGSDLPDAHVTSKILYDLKQKGLIEKLEANTYVLTDGGFSAINEHEGANNEPKVKAVEETKSVGARINPKLEGLDLTIINTSEVMTILNSIAKDVQSIKTLSPVIKDKENKLWVLNTLAKLQVLDSEVIETLYQIILDLEGL